MEYAVKFSSLNLLSCCDCWARLQLLYILVLSKSSIYIILDTVHARAISYTIILVQEPLDIRSCKTFSDLILTPLRAVKTLLIETSHCNIADVNGKAIIIFILKGMKHVGRHRSVSCKYADWVLAD